MPSPCRARRWASSTSTLSAAQALVAGLDDAPTRPLFTPGDVTRIEELRAAVQATAAAFGDIGVLVNNVANDQRHDFGSVDVATFDKTVAVNLRPAFFAAQAVVPGMQRRGSGVIVNVGSASWLMKSADLSVYATCKSAMTGLTRTLANELGAAPHPRQPGDSRLGDDRQAAAPVGRCRGRGGDGPQPAAARAGSAATTSLA